MNLACQSTLWNSLGLTSKRHSHTKFGNLKGKRLLDYLTTVCVNKSKKFLQNYARFQRMRGPQSGCSDDVIEMTLLLLSYFDEEEESMFFHVEDTCLAEEVQLEQVPLTPVVIVCGQSCYSSTRYMLSLDRTLLTQTSPPSFLHCASYLGLRDLESGSEVLVLIRTLTGPGLKTESQTQTKIWTRARCFFSNPEKGTKVENKNSKRRLNVNPRVLTLIQELSDHEWR
ncbi:uncharacterized protein LOC122342383 [Puntigrus tetrazona]|uniref:uncharacterized protein LOC122342383 n=1 Tax=Puntigrus tetrazona TaxID=1606681 RepID=UPI001C8AB1B3|nr:uncharacterized protein LOC122342383 [Puntigrus tetrazona]